MPTKQEALEALNKFVGLDSEERAAMKILRAYIESAGKDAELHNALQRAARDLPKGFEIRVSVENGAGWVNLYDEDYDEVPTPEDDEHDLASEVNAAIDAAITAAKESHDGN